MELACSDLRHAIGNDRVVEIETRRAYDRTRLGMINVNTSALTRAFVATERRVLDRERAPDGKDGASGIRAVLRRTPECGNYRRCVSVKYVIAAERTVTNYDSATVIEESATESGATATIEFATIAAEGTSVAGSVLTRPAAAAETAAATVVTPIGAPSTGCATAAAEPTFAAG
jgi:hypothetical protein